VSRFVLACIFIIAAAPTAAAGQQVPPTTHRVQGTVHMVDVRGGALEVTTGVGMALRVVRLQVPAALRVTASGTPLPFARLQAGDIVLVSYGSRPGGNVAYTIERLERIP
jgi:hypothetical protein